MYIKLARRTTHISHMIPLNLWSFILNASMDFTISKLLFTFSHAHWKFEGEVNIITNYTQLWAFLPSLKKSYIKLQKHLQHHVQHHVQQKHNPNKSRRKFQCLSSGWSIFYLVSFHHQCNCNDTHKKQTNKHIPQISLFHNLCHHYHHLHKLNPTPLNDKI